MVKNEIVQNEMWSKLKVVTNISDTSFRLKFIYWEDRFSNEIIFLQKYHNFAAIVHFVRLLEYGAGKWEVGMN